MGNIASEGGGLSGSGEHETDGLGELRQELERRRFGLFVFAPQFGRDLDQRLAQFSYLARSGLEKRGLTAGAVKDERLYLIIYTGTRLRFYDKHRDDVERMIRSIKFL